jgi:hypothetical protein
MTPATSPSVMSRIAAPVERTSRISSSWRGRSRMQTVMSSTSQPRARQRAHAFGRRHVQRHGVGRKTRPDRQLVHVDIGRVQERAARRHRDHRQRVRHVLGGQRRALERVERDIHRRAVSGAHFLADEEHRRLVAFPFADHHDALDIQHVQLVAHRVDGGLVGGLLVAAADVIGRGQCRGLGHAGESQREHAVVEFG